MPVERSLEGLSLWASPETPQVSCSLSRVTRSSASANSSGACRAASRPARRGGLISAKDPHQVARAREHGVAEADEAPSRGGGCGRRRSRARIVRHQPHRRAALACERAQDRDDLASLPLVERGGRRRRGRASARRRAHGDRHRWRCPPDSRRPRGSRVPRADPPRASPPRAGAFASP